MMAQPGLTKVVDNVNKLQQDVAVVATLVDRLEDSVEKFERQTELLHSRISSGERQLSEKIDLQYDEIMRELKEMRTESLTQHDSLSDRITALEKWIWVVIGGSVVVGVILSQVDFSVIFG